MPKELLPYPIEVEINTSNINIDSITRDGNKTFWPETKSSADKFLVADVEGRLNWTDPPNNLNVLKTGDTMTGTLTLPSSGLTAKLNFSSALTTGLSGDTNGLYLYSNGTKGMQLGSSGVSINTLNTSGILHNNSSGLLTSSLIINSDITPNTITNSSLATLSSSNIPSYIVRRDSDGNFETKMITITGPTLQPNDVATKTYVDVAMQLGFNVHNPAVALGINNIGSLSGLLNIDGVELKDQDRVLLVGQTNKIQNGVHLASAGAWTRPTDLNTGDLAESVYILVLQGDTYKGSAWVCNTPDAIIGTNNITFIQFSIPSSAGGSNVGSGSGRVYKNTTGNTLNFKTIIANQHISLVDGVNDLQIGTDATNLNTISTIVARDTSGGFSAGTITANVIGSLTGVASGNLPSGGGTVSGAILLPNGTLSAPSLAFSSSSNTGLAYTSSNTMSLIANGLQIMKVSNNGCFNTIPSVSMWIGSSFSGTTCVFIANNNTGFVNRGSPSSTITGFTNWIYTGIYEVIFNGSLYNTTHGMFTAKIYLNGNIVISTQVDTMKGNSSNYYNFSIIAQVGIFSLSDNIKCNIEGLVTSFPNQLYCSIKYLGM